MDFLEILVGFEPTTFSFADFFLRPLGHSIVGQTGYAPVPSAFQTDASTKLASDPNVYYSTQIIGFCPI